MMKPPFNLTNKMLNDMVEISRLIGQLQVQHERNLALRRESRIQSIQSSLAIENNSLSLEQVTAILDGRRVLGPPKDIQEVKNAYEAYEEILTYNPFSAKDFLKAHKLLTQGLVKQSGRFRSGDVGIYNAQGQVIHVGARPQFVQGLVADLFKWAKQDETPLLIKSAVVHYEIEMIHPFEDGNGRMGRLWQSVLLSRWNPLFAWLPVETMVHEHQEAYYRELRKADAANNSTGFIEFMLDMILQTLKKYPVMPIAHETSDNLSDKMSDKATEVYQTILKYLTNHHTITAQKAAELTGKSAPTIRRYLAGFVEADLLVGEGSNKSRIYRLSKVQDKVEEI
ncbi:Fic family protein [Neisseria mucosa]|jgi:fic family protein|uniref:Fic family protein n=1 Tax=Neisseria mucosa TaxID=488 RepID=UPI001F3CC2E8|nr:Fic family protein [Neisseria mucosa]